MILLGAKRLRDVDHLCLNEDYRICRRLSFPTNRAADEKKQKGKFFPAFGNSSLNIE